MSYQKLCLVTQELIWTQSIYTMKSAFALCSLRFKDETHLSLHVFRGVTDLPSWVFNFLKNDFYVSCFWMLLLTNKYSIKFVGENIIIQRCTCIKSGCIYLYFICRPHIVRQIYASFWYCAILLYPFLSPRFPFSICNKIHTYRKSSYKIMKRRGERTP